MSNLPCKECIVMPMCKSRIHKNKLDLYNAWGTVVALSRTCPSLRKYINPDEPYHYSLKHRHDAVLFLTGVDLRKRFRYEI